MFKKVFKFSVNGNGSAHTDAIATTNPESAESVAERPEPAPRETIVPPKWSDFEQIYQSAAVKLPRMAYGILKVREMAESPHLAGMTPEAKRCALLMALEAAGVEIEDLLQDAIARQRALSDYEDGQQTRLGDLEARKTEENRAIQGELDRITAQYMARIQANLDEIAHQQDQFHAWQKRKQQECQRMTDTAALLVPPGSMTQNGTLTAVLERASAGRR
jgi:hypothetical protein